MRRLVRSVLGADLSACSAAAVAVPLDWGGNWARVSTLVVGASLAGAYSELDLERALRTGTIADELVEFALQHRCFRAQIESYGFSRRTQAHTLGEVGGVVRLHLVRVGVEIATSNMSTSRKLLLGHVPKGADPKALVHAALIAAGAPWANVEGAKDLSDAFTAANLYLAEERAFAFIQAPT